MGQILSLTPKKHFNGHESLKKNWLTQLSPEAATYPISHPLFLHGIIKPSKMSTFDPGEVLLLPLSITHAKLYLES